MGGGSPSVKSVFADTSRVFRHRVRKTAHYGHLIEDVKLACGRCVSTGFEFMDPNEVVGLEFISRLLAVSD